MKKPKDMLTPEQIIEIAIRHRWFIIIPFMAAMIAGIYLALTLPRIYEAGTLILVEQQRVPTDYVRSVVSIDISDRINTIRQQIMSRSNLEKIINQFNLYSSADQQNMFMEDKIAALTRRITVDVTQYRRETNSFSISFQGQDPELVARIANSLASFFIDENLKVREAQAIGTSDFLDDEVMSMRAKLEEVEEKLKQYRERNMGELPEQLQTNLSILNRLQDRLVDRQQSLREEKNRLLSLENQIKIFEEQRAALREDGQPAAAVAQESEIDRLKRQLEDLKTRYTDKHPDVARMEKRINDLEKNEVAGDDAVVAVPIRTPENLAGIDGIIADYKRQQFDIQSELKVIESEISDLMSQIKFYQQRVENTPKREQELLTLNRDYSNIQETYNSLLGRKLEAEISVNMEKKQKGEQFRILDSARVPERPVKPDLRKIFLLAIGAGLGLGGGIIFLLEYLNTSFRKPEDVEGFLGLPVLATIPKLIHERERRMKKLNWALSIVSVGASLVLFAGFAALTFNGVEKTLGLVKRFISL